MSAVGGNYISDGQIMAWLANQQDRIYGDLKESMDLAETRAEVVVAGLACRALEKAELLAQGSENFGLFNQSERKIDISQDAGN